ncbi:Crp/Fnr family transcriptional regulator [Trichothermofontia sichuanensis B231]|uniref:Crp/Fnr family transcriptional regulator n=1 Tax=Trichothermofontia sichuanensis TaxID=3045816 RepID=UPI0022468CA6|nr:Crp/Fnr family transcriptional regulator [Trichothermofontia sichuanensis]UZQ54222.1 Crp/Fnr family transcriptional regulator [Trichothermofontia sichuanensis B231]
MLSTIDLSYWLKTTPLFCGLSPAQLRAIAAIAQLQTFPKGDHIFHQGSAATGFFVVKIGRIKIFKLSTQGKEQILHFCGPGDHFAEVPALDGQDFPASAATLEPSEVIFLPRIAFIELLHQYPDIAITMLISLSQHARRLSQLVEDLSFKEVPQRLATYLLNLSDRTLAAAPNHAHTPNVIELDLSKSQLAAVLGTIPATLSRAFDRLSREGMIVIDGTRIELRDRDRLQELSQSLERRNSSSA